MFEKRKLKAELAKQMELIEVLEKKRYRSQSKLVEAILKQDTPDDDDVDYFNKYTEQIDEVRVMIQDLQRQLADK